MSAEEIVKKKEIWELFFSLPKKWQQTIWRALEKAEVELSLLREDVDKLRFTTKKCF